MRVPLPGSLGAVLAGVVLQRDRQASRRQRPGEMRTHLDGAGSRSARRGRPALYLEALEQRWVLSLVAAYNFDQGTGTTVTDSSGNGNNGTLTNAAWSAAGKFASALSFNGSLTSKTEPVPIVLSTRTSPL